MPSRRRWRATTPPIVGWVLYDFANTIFSFVVVTRYFNDWIIDERGQPDIYVGLMTAAVSIALVGTLPLIGARADRVGHMPILVSFSILCAAATALLGVVDPVWLALLVAGVATYAFNTADSQYHPLLAVVAPERSRGRISGIGVSLGFVGSLIALFALGAYIDDGEAQKAFIPAAAMFAAFALPCFLLVRDRKERRAREPSAGTSFARLRSSFRRARAEPFGRLLLARFLYIDAIATAIQFTGIYARRTGDFDGNRIDALLAIAAVAAIGGAVGGGLVAERIGPRRVVLATLAIAVAALALTAVTGASALLWVAGPLIGVALGSLSAVDRIFLLRLIPEERRGEDFALYALVGKLSSGFGPLILWGGTILVLTEFAGMTEFGASRIAIGVLAASALAGLLVLRPLSDRDISQRPAADRDPG